MSAFVRGCHKHGISAFVVDGSELYNCGQTDFRRRIQFCFTYNPGSATFLDLIVSNVAGPPLPITALVVRPI